MKILCFIDSLGSGGAQRQMVELAKGFKEKGHDVSFLTYHKINFFKPELDKYEIKVNTIVESNYIKRLLKIRKAIRAENPDAVLSFLEAANFIATIAGLPYRKWKLVVGERSANPQMLKSLKSHVFRFFHILANYVVANSRSNIELVRKMNPILAEKKLKVIYNLIDTKIWKQSTEHCYNDDKLKIVVGSSHQYLKNLRGLLEAICILPSELKDNLQIKWFGDKSLDNSYNEALDFINHKSLNHIVSLQPATLDIKQHFESADVVGLFSFYEGFPNVICEAMMLAKPVISSKVSDLPLFINDRCLFDANDTENIATVITECMKMSPFELIELGTKNREIALQLFDKENTINLYLNLFE